METKKNYYFSCEDPFEKPWCPLFGEIPRFGGAESSPQKRCMRIIDEARKFWNIGPNLSHGELVIRAGERILFFKVAGKAARELFTLETNWPAEIPGYSGKLLTAARSICWWNYEYIYKQACFFMPEIKKHFNQGDGAFFKEPDSKWVTNYDLDTTYDDAIDAARKGINWPREIDGEISDYAILAALAIAEAWRALKSIFYYREEASDRISKKVQVASSLLAWAKVLRNEEARTEAEASRRAAEDKVNELFPDAKREKERHQKAVKSGKEGAKVVQDRATSKKRPWLQEAELVWKNHQDWKHLTIATQAAKKFKIAPTDTPFQNFYKTVNAYLKNLKKSL